MNRRDDNFFPPKKTSHIPLLIFTLRPDPDEKPSPTSGTAALLHFQSRSPVDRAGLIWNWNHFFGNLAFEVWIFFCKNNFDFLSPAGSPAWPRGDRQAGQQAALPQCYRWQYSQPSFYFDFINTSISDLDELHLSYLQFFPSYQHRDKARSITWAKNKSIRAPSFISTFRLLSLITEIGSWSQVKQRKKPKGTKISREHKSE